MTDKLGHANFIKRVYSLDPEYTPKMVDEGRLPRTNVIPDQEYLSSLPRVLYHSGDRAAMAQASSLVDFRRRRAEPITSQHAHLGRPKCGSLREREPDSPYT